MKNFVRGAAYLNVDDDEEEDDDGTASPSPLKRTNWTELKGQRNEIFLPPSFIIRICLGH